MFCRFILFKVVVGYCHNSSSLRSDGNPVQLLCFQGNEFIPGLDRFILWCRPLFVCLPVYQRQSFLCVLTMQKNHTVVWNSLFSSRYFPDSI